MSEKIKSSLAAAAAAVLLVALDQWTKFLAVSHLKEQPPIELIPGVLELNYYENHGAAFGILQNRQTFFIVLTLVFLLLIIFLYWKLPQSKKFLPMRWVAVGIFAGAVGNFIDRFFHGYVVDFVYIKLINFPIFNVADCYVTLSAAALLILAFFFYREDSDWEWLHFFRKSSEKDENHK